MKNIIAFLAASWLALSPVQAGTIYVDTAANGSASATFSGSTDTTSATATGTAATVTGTTVTLDVSTNLGTVNTSGPAQTSINIAGATNTNRTIFWITSVTSGCTGTAVACVIVVDTAPTGVTTNAWAVGGRYLWPSGSTVDKAVNALRAGDTLIFNTAPATRTATYMTLASSGDSTSGFITVMGKAGGGRVLLDVGSTAIAVVTGSGAPSDIYFKNLEFRQANGGSVALISGFGTNLVLDNIKVNHPSGTSTTGSLINLSANAMRMINSEIVSNNTGTTDCINAATSNSVFIGNYIHGCGGDGIEISLAQPGLTIIGNIFSSNGGSAINLSGASTTQAQIVTVEGNTFYANVTAGITVADADTTVWMVNNIFQNDGTHANVVWSAGNCDFVSYHAYNVFYASGGTNLTNCSANATEFTTDPLFVNAGSGNFAISNSSPAAGTGFPGAITGSTSTGYRDMGAVQRQITAGGGGGQVFGQ